MAGNKTKTDRIHDRMPKFFDTKNNPNWSAVIQAIGEQDEELSVLIEEVKKQLFIKSASRPYLDRLGANSKVQRPRSIGMDDPTFRTYIPIIAYKPKQVKKFRDQATLIHWLKKDGTKNMVTAYNEETEGAQKAELSFRVLGKQNDHFLLEIKPKTGRPHQIRAQLGAIKTPIKGDLKYGFTSPNVDKSINLHARKLYFQHPVKKEPIEISAPLPETDFWEQFLSLEQIKLKDKDIDTRY